MENDGQMAGVFVKQLSIGEIFTLTCLALNPPPPLPSKAYMPILELISWTDGAVGRWAKVSVCHHFMHAYMHVYIQRMRKTPEDRCCGAGFFFLMDQGE